MTHLDRWYGRMISGLMRKGVREVNRRTGHETASFAGVTFRTDIETDGFPLLTLRPINIKAFVAEQVWFQQGDNDPEWLQKYTKIWDAFVEEDGRIGAAYGYRWRNHWKTDQIEQLVRLLTVDPSSRQGVVVTWDVDGDGHYANDKKNVPCPFTFTVNIIGGRLNMHNVLRSNDMVLGFPFDVAGFALLQMMLAQRLGVRPGVYTHSISNGHVYDVHYAGAEEMVRRWSAGGECDPGARYTVLDVRMPDNALARAQMGDDSLVSDLVVELERQYVPMAKIEGLGIVK